MTPFAAMAEPASGNVISGDALNGCYVIMRPTGEKFVGINIPSAGTSSSICVKGNNTEDDVQLYNTGDSNRLLLTKVDNTTDCYNIRHFEGTDKKNPSEGYFGIKDNKVHTTKSHSGTDTQWQFIRQEDGTYWVKNVKNGKYWAMEKSGYDDGNKVVLSDTPRTFQLQIIEENEKIPTKAIKENYDSYSFRDDKGHTVTGLNWMTYLSDDLCLGDLSIPGTHDASAVHTSSSNDMAQCQYLTIAEQLAVGTRYFDLRFGKEKDSSGKQVLKMVHGSTTAQFKGQTIMWSTVWGWFKSFLQQNPGETIFLQLKEDSGGKDTEQMVYNFFKGVKNDPIIFKGDYIPTLGEARGKIVLISRLGNFKDFGSGANQWAFECSNWKTSKDFTSQLVVSGAKYEIWDQDDASMTHGNKWKHVDASIFSTDRGPETRMQSAEKNKKKALVVDFTSANAVNIFESPQDEARHINPKFLATLAVWKTRYTDKRLGTIVMDFIDAILAYEIYQHNYQLFGGSESAGNPDETISVNYKGPDGSDGTVADVKKLTHLTTNLAAGWYAVTEDTTISDRIVAEGDVNLILSDGVKLTSPKGIDIGSYAFTIWGQSEGSGQLAINEVDSGKQGIGGGSNSSLTINGGNITAKGGGKSAGIGPDTKSTGMSITINGGTVKAYGNTGAAGIGGSYKGAVPKITITGGTITANGGIRGAGIGSGDFNTNPNDITISGGEITASSEGFGAGIGGGGDDRGDVGTITISGGKISAIGERGAGIGGGFGDNCNVTIRISGGDIQASGTAGRYTGIGFASTNNVKSTNTADITLTWDSEDSGMRIKVSAIKGNVTLEKNFMAEESSTIFNAGPVEDTSVFSNTSIVPAAENAAEEPSEEDTSPEEEGSEEDTSVEESSETASEANTEEEASGEMPSETGSVFGSGAAWIVIILVVVLVAFAVAFAVIQSKKKKNGSDSEDDTEDDSDQSSDSDESK